jgi:hypothetical protein
VISFFNLFIGAIFEGDKWLSLPGGARVRKGRKSQGGEAWEQDGLR